MEDLNTNQPSSTDYRPRRRQVLQVLAAGAGLSALSGLGQARSIAPLQQTGAVGPLEQAAAAQVQSGDSIHPVFGFSAFSSDVEPPVEPDHDVQLLISERAGAPPEAPPEFFFEPTGLAIEPGDTVQFTMTTPHHNIVAYHPAFGYVQRVPDGVPAFSGPMLPAGGYWLYTFEEEGVYEMNCAPHEIFGMVMRIVVGEPAGPAAEPLPDVCAPEPAPEEATPGPEARLPDFTAYTVLTDPALDPEQIVENGSVSWEALAPESKQLFVQTVGFPPCERNDSGENGNSNGEGSGNGGKAKQGGNGKAKAPDATDD